jgi:DNA polymerase
MGVSLPDMQAHTVEKAIAETEGVVQDALILYQGANKTSLAKYDTMLEMADDKGRIREQFVFHGAHTGRWSGRGVQLQNLPRSTLNIPTCVEAIRCLEKESFEIIYPEVSTALSHAIRGMLIPPAGYRFFQTDFSQLESRIVCWLAGQENVLDDYRNGADVYVNQAQKIYGKEDIDKEERQTGKVSILSLGYQGGIKAFINMGKNYRLNMEAVAPLILPTATANEIRIAEFCYVLYLKNAQREGLIPVSKDVAMAADIIKQRWREANPMIVQFWDDLEATAIEAVRTNKPVDCGRVRWFTHKKFLHCKLPSGRVLSYLYPKLSMDAKEKVSLAYRGTKGYETCYGGKWAENITQAVNGCLQRESMLRVEEKYPVCLHVHDEIVSPVKNGEGSLEEYIELMKVVPAWAEGLPIDASGWEGERFDKR